MKLQQEMRPLLVINKTHDQPANLMAKIMNSLAVKRTIGKGLKQILSNIKSLTEK